MSETELFTEEDAQNDGKIKKEVSKKMAQNAKTHAPEMFKRFSEVCEDMGMEPREVLGQHVLMSLKDESHSEMLAKTTVDMSRLESDRIMKEDAEFVQELTEDLGLGESSSTDPVDKLIERRLEAKTGPVIPGANVAEDREVSSDVGKQLAQLQEQVNNLQSQVEHSGRSADTDGEEKKDIDDLFSDNDDGDAGEEDVDIKSVDEKGDVPSSEDGVNDNE